MAWSSSKARVGAKVASGAFNQPNNTIADAIDTGAGIMAKSILRKGEEDRLEKREAKKLAAAEARSIAAAQRKKEEEAKKIQRQANAIATRMGVSPTNTDLRNHITESVYAFGDGAAALLQDDLKEGRLIITSTSFDEELVKTGARMDQPPPIRFNSRSDGSLFTSLNYGSYVDNLEATGNDTDADEANYIKSKFKPQQLNSGETEIVQGTIEGFEVNPTAEKSDIDWQNVNTAGEVERIRMLHDSGDNILDEKGLKTLVAFEESVKGKVTTAEATAALNLTRTISVMNKGALMGVTSSTNDELWSAEDRKYAKTLLEAIIKAESPSNLEILIDLSKMLPDARQNLENSLKDSTDPAQVVVRDALGLMKAGAGADLSSYFSNISTPVTVAAKKLAVLNSNLSKSDKQRVMSQLDGHLQTLEKTKDELKLTDEVYYGEIKNLDGSISKIEVLAKENGEGFYSASLNKSFTSDDFIPNSILSAANVSELGGASRGVQEKVIAPMNSRRSDITDLLSRAISIDNLVKESDGKVLTFIGGRAPALIKRISEEYKLLNTFVSGVSDIATQAARISQENLPTATELSDLGISADQFSRFQAQAIEFAYVYARTAMGQERTTDRDFEAAFKVVVAGSDYPTFTRNLRGLVQEGFTKAQRAHDLLLDHPSIKSASLIPNYELTFGDQMKTLDEYLEGQDVGTSIEWMKTEIEVAELPEEIDPPAELTLGQKVSIFKNDGGFALYKEKFDQFIKPEQKEMMIQSLAKALDINVDVVRLSLTGVE